MEDETADSSEEDTGIPESFLIGEAGTTEPQTAERNFHFMNIDNRFFLALRTIERKVSHLGIFLYHYSSFISTDRT